MATYLPFSKRPRVLLVDDSALDLHVLRGILSLDYDVLLASSGLAALTIAQGSEPPDLILLDVMMPGMDGYEVCKTLKADETTQGIPIVFLTAMEGSASEIKGFELGAADYITKPFSKLVVRARVRNQIQLKQRADLLEKLAFLDGLTSIPNRRRFEQYFQEEWRRAMRNRSPLALLMLDVDHFKQFNDRYGHGAGDDCLRRIARTIADVGNRAGDLAARYGGEEFAVLLDNTDIAGAVLVAERVRSSVLELAIPHANSTVGPVVTVSIGVASRVPERDEPALSLLELADQALYVAKQAGRNQVSASPPVGDVRAVC